MNRCRIHARKYTRM